METGDVIFARSNTLIGKIIRFFDKGKFTHVALAVSNKRIIEAQYNVKSHIISFDKAMKDYKESEIISMHLTEKQKQHLIEILPKYLKRRYDFLLAFSMATKWLRIDKSKYLICTELNMDILKEIDVLDKGLKDMKPNEFYRYLKSLKEYRDFKKC